MDRNCLVTHWIITTLSNDVREEGGVKSREWEDGMISTGEGLSLLDLVATIAKATQHIMNGEIVVYSDNKKLVRKINAKVKKVSECTLEAGAIVE